MLLADMGDLVTPLSSAGAAILVAGVGGFFRIMHNISIKFGELGSKIDQIMDTHERRDQDRHDENIGRFDEVKQRLTRVETLVNGYNGRGRKRQ